MRQIRVMLMIVSAMYCCMASINLEASERQKQNAELFEIIAISDPDVRREQITAFCKYSGWTSDEFSEKLIEVAKEVKKDYSPGIYGYIMGAICRFGTSNALDYVRNEALHGPDHSGGLKAYALISGFDNEAFALADIVFSGQGRPYELRKLGFYIFLNGVLTSTDGYSGRRLSAEGRSKCLEYLYKSAETEICYPRTLDRVIKEGDSEYEKSDRRRKTVTALAETLSTNSHDFAYFREEYAKLLKDGKEQKDGLSLKCASTGTEATWTEGDSGEKSKSKTMAIFACVAVAAAVVAYLLKRKRR